jgi:LEA14-like dessication related protein/DNA-directed RNA polymerase subunit H (RpoH/RPB5)
MKKYFPVIALGAAAVGIVYWLKRKALAGANLRYEPVDVAIDLQKTKQSLFTRIYYKVKLNLINNESVSVNVKSLSLNVFVGSIPFGSIVKNESFSIPAQSNEIIELNTSFSSFSALALIKDIILQGFQDPIVVKGFIQTDLGRINVDFTKNLSGGITGRMKMKKTKTPKFRYDDKVYSYQNPTSPGYIRFIRKSEDPNYSNKYKLVLYDDNGYSYSSNWINEESLSKRKIKGIGYSQEHILNNIQGNC